MKKLDVIFQVSLTFSHFELAIKIQNTKEENFENQIRVSDYT